MSNAKRSEAPSPAGIVRRSWSTCPHLSNILVVSFFEVVVSLVGRSCTTTYVGSFRTTISNRVISVPPRGCHSPKSTRSGRLVDFKEIIRRRRESSSSATLSVASFETLSYCSPACWPSTEDPTQPQRTNTERELAVAVPERP